jgi:hypothetical protein
MDTSVIDQFSGVDDDPAPPPPPAPVVGAPAPGSKTDYTQVPTPDTPDPSIMDQYSGVDDPADVPPTEESLRVSHPLFGQEPGAQNTGARGESLAYWPHFFGQLPLVGGALEENMYAQAAKKRASLMNISVPWARAQIDAQQRETNAAHPGYAKGGDITGAAAGLTAIMALAPEAFGGLETSKTAGAALGATSNILVKSVDDWLRGKKSDPGELALTGLGGGLGGAFAAGMQAMVKPGLDELAQFAVDNKIRLPAGAVSNNPWLSKLTGRLSKVSLAQARDDWYRAIPRLIGSDAPRLTAKILGERSKYIADRVRVLRDQIKAGGQPDNPGLRQVADDALRGVSKGTADKVRSRLGLGPSDSNLELVNPELLQLAEQAKYIRALEGVMKVDSFGRFTPEQFHAAIQEGVDAMAAHTGEATFANGGGGALAELARVGTTLLKGAPNPALDREAVWHFVRQAATLIGPGAGAHYALHGLSIPELSTAGIVTGVVAGAKLIGKLLSAYASASPRLGNALVNANAVAGPAAAAVARPVVPAAIQQAVPPVKEALDPAPPPPPAIRLTRKQLLGQP